MGMHCTCVFMAWQQGAPLCRTAAATLEWISTTASTGRSGRLRGAGSGISGVLCFAARGPLLCWHMLAWLGIITCSVRYLCAYLYVNTREQAHLWLLAI